MQIIGALKAPVELEHLQQKQLSRVTKAAPCRKQQRRVDAEGLLHQFEASAEAEEGGRGSRRATQRLGGLTQLARGVDLLVSGLLRNLLHNINNYFDE